MIGDLFNIVLGPDAGLSALGAPAGAAAVAQAESANVATMHTVRTDTVSSFSFLLFIDWQLLEQLA